MNSFLALTILIIASFVSVPDYERENVKSCWNKYERRGDKITYDCSPVVGVDAQTFTHEGGPFAEDKNHVYCKGEPLPDVVPNDFIRLSYLYGIDKTRVFSNCSVTPGAIPETFTVYPQFDGWGYARDSKRVYYDGQPIAGADAASFVLLDFGHAKDAMYYYHHGSLYDPKKAQQDGELVNVGEEYPYSKTAHAVFYKGKSLIGADPSSFVETFGIPASMKLNVAQDKAMLWIEDTPYPLAGPTRQVGSPSGDDMPVWLLGKNQLAYINVDQAKKLAVNIVPVDAGSVEMQPYAAYAIAGDQVIHRGKVLAGADARTFTTLSDVLPNFFSNGETQYAYDQKHIYQEDQPIFTFDGTAQILWPKDNLDGWVSVFLFKDGQTLWLTLFDQSSYKNTVRLPVTADAFTLIAPLRNAHSKPFDALVGTDGTQVFYNDHVLEGVVADGLKVFETSDRQGVIGDNALILSAYRNLSVRNTQTGEIHAVGKDGWQHVRITDDDGAPDRAELFDGRVHVHIERYLRVWGDDETPDDSTWEAIVPEGEDTPKEE